MTAQRAAEGANSALPSGEGFAWVEFVKAVALIWIFVNHVAERIFGEAYMANPAAGWPPMASRLAQLHPMLGHGLCDIPTNLVRYVGWCGDQGVQLFLIVSGFGITWGLMARGEESSPSLRKFYLRRAERIYPMWWACHLLFLVPSLILGGGMSLRDSSFYESILGFRMTTESLYYYAPAWWYVGLIVQLYIVYPLLWTALRSAGPLKFLGITCAVSFALRGAGLLYFDAYLDAWSRGAIFVTRLPEFALGMCLAAWIQRDARGADAFLRSPYTVLVALAVYPIATGLSLTLRGMTVAPFMLGVSVFVVLYALCAKPVFARPRIAAPFNWVGRHSYSLYLVHGPMVRMWCPAGAGAGFFSATIRIGLAMLSTLALAALLEWSVTHFLTRLRVWRKQWGIPRLLAVAAFIGVTIAAVLMAGDWAVERYDPQETRGWGERTSLEPHSAFGWRLKPSTTTRLRWEGYDYTVTANSLGFPGPEYPKEKAPGAIRIFAMGDAFTSAEGVDTNQSWPRMLETKLRAAMPTRAVEVMDFAVTGYGPEQTVAVAETFVPEYRPDLIIYGFFVNEYFDVLENNERFRDSIGLTQPPIAAWKSRAHLDQLRTYLSITVGEPLRALIHGPSESHGYLFGQFAALERGRTEVNFSGKKRVRQQLQRLKAIADRAGAQVLIVMIPSSAQVCGPEDLAYYPWRVNLSDTKKYDVDQPQRVTQELANDLQFPVFDLRPVLTNARSGHPYQRYNMHWTAYGHECVAAYLGARLVVDGYVKDR